MDGGESAECKWGELLMAIDYLVTDTELSDIADAIRAKGGTSASISFPNGFTTAIAAIPTGITPTGTKQITISGAGTVTEDVTNYASAEVTTPAGTAGTPTATKGAVSGNAVSVTPSVTNSAGWVGSETKSGTPVSVTAAELVSGTLPITENGTVDVTNYAAVDVNVSGGGGEIPVQAQVTSCPYGTFVSYVDDEGVFHADESMINPADGWSDTVMKGNLVVLTYRGTGGTSTVVNMILRQTVTCKGRNVSPVKYEIYEVSV